MDPDNDSMIQQKERQCGEKSGKLMFAFNMIDWLTDYCFSPYSTIFHLNGGV
jgi:hypothetical protein